MKFTSFFVVLTVLSITQPSLAQTVRQHHAHEHGAARLSIAAEGNQLQIELDSPAYNVFGFEHPPHTDSELARVAQASDTLKEGVNLFEFEPAIGCELWQFDLIREKDAHEDEHSGDHAEDEHTEDHAEDELHQEVLVRWGFQCQNLRALERINTNLFEAFDLLQDLDVTYLIDDNQGAIELSPAQTQIQIQ